MGADDKTQTKNTKSVQGEFFVGYPEGVAVFYRVASIKNNNAIVEPWLGGQLVFNRGLHVKPLMQCCVELKKKIDFSRGMPLLAIDKHYDAVLWDKAPVFAYCEEFAKKDTVKRAAIYFRDRISEDKNIDIEKLKKSTLFLVRH